MVLRIEIVPYDHPDAGKLIDEGQQDEAERYGNADETPVDPDEFVPPKGVFMVGYADGVPVACGGWRSHGGDAELKRMYVVPAARGNGFARMILTELEQNALRAGHQRMILETGKKQPEAIALYRSMGYVYIPNFGYYANEPDCVCLAKALTPAA